MRFAVINGSPKGSDSFTVGYVKFIEKKTEGHSFSYHNVAQRIGKIASDADQMEKIIADMEQADGIIWSFPLYYCLVCGQMMEFLELLSERAGDRLKGKHCISISTSIHFFDHTAHEYIHAISEDLGMEFVDLFSANIQDLFDAENQKKLLIFFADFVDAVDRDLPTLRLYDPVQKSDFDYRPTSPKKRLDIGSRKIVIVTDSLEGNIGRMVSRLSDAFAGGADVIDISRIKLISGCLGCCECALDNVCALNAKDELKATMEEMGQADGIVYAGSVKLRYFSSLWQKFFNRSFYTGHAPQFVGKQGAMLVSGPLSSLHTMQEVLNVNIDLSGANHLGFVTDQSGDSAKIDAMLDNLALLFARRFKDGFVRLPLFPAYAGQKVFRDDIYGRLRFPFIKDHQFYRDNGYYDFPKVPFVNRLFYAFASTSFGAKQIKGRFRDEMKKPMEKFLAEV